MQPDIRKGSIRPSMLVFAIRKPREPSVVPPIRRSKVTAKARRQQSCCNRRKRFRQNLSVVQPCLKVPRRSFQNNRWREAFQFQTLDDLDTGVVD
jgi:hypothetical protein